MSKEGDHTPLTENSSTGDSLADMTSRLSQMMNQIPTVVNQEPLATPIGVKLDGTDYALWSQIVEMYISGKEKLGHVNGDLPQPQPTDSTFKKWRTDVAIVKGWLINSMDPALISNFIRLPTAKMVWDSIATTYFDGTDTSKGYDLRRRVTRMRQAGGPIEKFYDDFQGLWREIDFRHPNPMECAVDIQKYNSIIQEDRVYTFLNGLDDRLDKVRSDVLQQKPFPTVEQAYAQIRCEDIRQAVMITGSGLEDTTGVVMASKGVKLGQQYSSSKLGSLSMSTGKLNTTPKAKVKSGGGCTHRGGKKHTRETCFKLHG
ncbi:hypothetical protein GH714_004151 [Hevea brasiliensis]|uniref:Uncharacterized protein n=1 Tax=Hevea brasiliensis TaxID=3981 RepID=A0A6A6NFL6_HEVBR|nr:hypothetical protein GH714_004151 [Hevea brasiliensis]